MVKDYSLRLPPVRLLGCINEKTFKLSIMKGAFISFVISGHTAWFDSHSEKLEPDCITNKH